MYHFIKHVNLNTKYASDPAASLFAGKYENGTPALFFEDDQQIPLIVATVDMTSYGETPAPGHVFIKNVSENQGILENLLVEGIVGVPIRTLSTQYEATYAVECPLLIDVTEKEN